MNFNNVCCCCSVVLLLLLTVLETFHSKNIQDHSKASFFHWYNCWSEIVEEVQKEKFNVYLSHKIIYSQLNAHLVSLLLRNCYNAPWRWLKFAVQIYRNSKTNFAVNWGKDVCIKLLVFSVYTFNRIIWFYILLYFIPKNCKNGDCKGAPPWILSCYIFLCEICGLTCLMMVWERAATCTMRVTAQLSFK